MRKAIKKSEVDISWSWNILWTDSPNLHLNGQVNEYSTADCEHVELSHLANRKLWCNPSSALIQCENYGMIQLNFVTGIYVFRKWL